MIIIFSKIAMQVIITCVRGRGNRISQFLPPALAAEVIESEPCVCLSVCTLLVWGDLDLS